MSRKSGISVFILGTLFMATASAEAAIYEWDWAPGDGGAVNNRAGRINSVQGRMDTATGELSWRVNFGDVPGHRNLETDGFTLALNNGPNPKGHAGELALLYFDASRSNPVLTAYAYNGQNNRNSFFDGSPQSGVQSPDKISSSLLDASWISELIDVDEADGTRTLGFKIDVGDIKSHSPDYPGPLGPSEWFGIGFDNKLGIWMHPFARLQTEYDDGYLEAWNHKKEGWLDGSDFNAVPEPTTIAFLAIGGLMMLRRRVTRK